MNNVDDSRYFPVPDLGRAHERSEPIRDEARPLPNGTPSAGRALSPDAPKPLALKVAPCPTPSPPPHRAPCTSKPKG